MVLLLALAVYMRWQEPRQKEPLNRTASLVFTHFALCQMTCRKVDAATVNEVLQKGLIHYNRSNRRQWPCPTYAVQARTENGRYLRVVFEQCNTKTAVLFCDDLEKEVDCNCAGDR
jgi:hypothetical protein